MQLFQEWLINEEQLPVFGMKLPTGFQLIGQVVSDITIYTDQLGFGTKRIQ